MVLSWDEALPDRPYLSLATSTDSPWLRKSQCPPPPPACTPVFFFFTALGEGLFFYVVVVL